MHLCLQLILHSLQKAKHLVTTKKLQRRFRRSGIPGFGRGSGLSSLGVQGSGGSGFQGFGSLGFKGLRAGGI